MSDASGKTALKYRIFQVPVHTWMVIRCSHSIYVILGTDIAPLSTKLFSGRIIYSAPDDVIPRTNILAAMADTTFESILHATILWIAVCSWWLRVCNSMTYVHSGSYELLAMA